MLITARSPLFSFGMRIFPFVTYSRNPKDQNRKWARTRLPLPGNLLGPGQVNPRSFLELLQKCR